MKTLKVRPMNSTRLIYQFVAKVFPLVQRELSGWQRRASLVPEACLGQQALESIRLKAFHCQGGSIFALYPGVTMTGAVRFIVAYQTMSDYLDNLVDSLEVQDELAFAQLHRAMVDALNPNAEPTDYYRYYPYRDDGGYLECLVQTCQEALRQLPSYQLVQEEALSLAQLYASLQTYKHLALNEREAKMLTWIEPYLASNPGITAWEFAAATGSTLGVFCLYAVASNPHLADAQGKQIREAYFPWIGGLHILLDYFIDLREDQETNQLNFVAYYDNVKLISDRLQLFLDRSLSQAAQLEHPKFHKAVVQGLLAMYLSDNKSRDSDIRPVTRQILKANGLSTNLLYWLCCRLRSMKAL